MPEPRSGSALRVAESLLLAASGVKLFAAGNSYAQIAGARGNKASTIKTAIYGIQEKLGVHSKREIVVWAVRNGLLD